MTTRYVQVPPQWGDDFPIPRTFALRLFLDCSNHQARIRERNPERYPNWPKRIELGSGRIAYCAGDLRRYFESLRAGEPS